MLLALIFLLKSELVSSFVKIGIEKCVNLQCDGIDEQNVCGMKTEGSGFRLKLFQSECDLLKYQCMNKDSLAYEIIDMNYCLLAFKEPEKETTELLTTKILCNKYNCSNSSDFEICSIRNDGEGFRIRLFENECQLQKYNCENQFNFTVTDFYICNSIILPKNEVFVNDTFTNADIITSSDDTKNLTSHEYDLPDYIYENHDQTKVENKTNFDDKNVELDTINENDAMIEDNDRNDEKPEKINNLIVVRSPLIDFNRINESVGNFFAATHVFDLPVKEVERSFLNESTRRRLIKVAGPVKVFVPWITIPKNISDDYDHRPTLSTCYHKCPRKCPSTYAPVCGVPGIVAREPSLMFQNHCFMDVAQCKMYWENKSPTALSSSYVESSFLFCLGDEMNGMYRFLPLIRTLQHMGRLRKKGRFHYRFHNMKFFNNLLSRQPKFMGK